MGTHTPTHSRTHTLSLLQSIDRHYTATRDGAPAGAGEKARGWAALSGTDVGVVAAMRDFWQEYPKGFAVTPDALDVRIWPEDAPEPASITPIGPHDAEEPMAPFDAWMELLFGA